MEFRALIVDDEETYARSMMRLLSRRGIAVDHASTCAEGLLRVRKRAYDLVLLDFLLPDGSGLDLIAPIRSQRPAGASEARRFPPQVLMMTAFGTIENAVEAMRRGAFDYVTKSTAIDGIVERVLDARRIAEARPSDGAHQEIARIEGLLGDSKAIKEARARILEVARASETTVLLTGESGTGKGVAARAIHAAGARASEPLVAIDCVALPPTLAESELFGHEKGAFTSADRMKPGKLELAGRGTVLLDEIGDMELALQGKLLRVLEERTFERVGGVKPLQFGARVIAASHRDLALRVEEGRFRLDLFHRLSVFPITIPALRDRGDDVVILAEHFTRDFAARFQKSFGPLGAPVREALLAYDFPGNVRELKNIIERATILATGPEITVDLLPPRIFAPRQSDSLPSSTRVRGTDQQLTVAFRPGQDTLDGIERQLLEEALRIAGGKRGRAAELLGISRFALLRRIEKYQL